MNNLAIITRRLYVYELHARGLTVPDIKRIAATQHDCHTRTIARDLNTMDTWLPEISQVRLDAEKVTADVMAKLLLCQRALLNLGETANTSASRVRAYNALINSLSLQTDFLFKSGLLKKVAERMQLEVKGHEWTLAEILTEYGDIIEEATEAYTQTAIEEESKRITREQDPRESLVSED